MLCAVLAGLALSSLAVKMVQREHEALESLVDAERAFSRACGEDGFRQSFLDHFAPEGVFFAPEPRNCVETLSSRPAEPKPAFPPFDWAPAIADVSAAGDLGYTTGPVRYWFEDGSKPARWGYYFSVWKRNGHGDWKVVADLGTDVGGADLGDPGDVKFRPAPDFRHGRSGKRPAEAAANSLLRAEDDFARKAETVPFADALAAVGTKSLRVHRDRALAATDRKAIAALMEGVDTTPVWETIGCEVSQSGDLGYTYGQYASNLAAGGVRKGYWVRVWKRDQNKWRLAVDVANGE